MGNLHLNCRLILVGWKLENEKRWQKRKHEKIRKCCDEQEMRQMRGFSVSL